MQLEPPKSGIFFFLNTLLIMKPFSQPPLGAVKTVKSDIFECPHGKMKKHFGMTLVKCTGFGGYHESRDRRKSQLICFNATKYGLHCGTGLKRKFNIRSTLKEELIGGRKEELPLHLENLSFTSGGWG